MMKRTVKNEKVLRAITIGLATMIAASSAPVNVFAAEDEEATGVTDNDDVSADAEANDMSDQQVDMASGDIDDAQEYAEELTEPAPEAAFEVQEALQPVVEAGVVAEAGNPSIPQLIDTVNEAYQAESVAEVKDSVVADLKEANEKVESVEEKLNEIEADLESSDEISVKNVNAFDITTKPVEVIATEEKEDENGDTVTVPVINEDNTVATTTSSDQMLVDFVDSYNKALSNIQAGNINEASGFATEAEAKLDEAEDTITRLGTAIKDSKAAEAAVKRAKEKAEIMAGLKDQYDKFMVHYYREKLGYNKDHCVYDFNEEGIGTLNIEKTAEKMISSGKVDTHPTPGDTKYVGRALLEQIVRLSLLEQGVDPDSIEYGINTDGKTVLNGDPNESSNKGTWAVKNNLNKVDRLAEDNESLYWFNVSDDAKNGRNNHVAVRYTDKDGNTQVECFNIIYKDIADEKKENNGLVIDAADLAKSPVFITKVTYNETTKSWEHQAYTDGARKAAFADVYDAKMLEAANEAYKKAQNDFEAAEAKATALRRAVEKLGFDISGRQSWEAELENAEAAVDNSRKQLEMLNKVIEQLTPEAAPAAEVTNEVAETPEASDDASEDTAASTVVDAGSATVTIPGGFDLSSFVLPTAVAADEALAAGATSGVLGARTDASEDNKEDKKEDFATYAKKVADNKVVVSKVDSEKSGKKGIKIADPIVPLADMPFEDDSEMNLWWLLLIALFGAAGKKMYDDHKKKQEEANAAK